MKKTFTGNRRICLFFHGKFIESNEQKVITAKKTVSPLIDKLHVHLDIFPEEEEKNKNITEQGFINFNLCLNGSNNKGTYRV